MQGVEDENTVFITCNPYFLGGINIKTTDFYNNPLKCIGFLIYESTSKPA